MNSPIAAVRGVWARLSRWAGNPEAHERDKPAVSTACGVRCDADGMPLVYTDCAACGCCGVHRGICLVCDFAAGGGVQVG